MGDIFQLIKMIKSGSYAYVYKSFWRGEYMVAYQIPGVNPTTNSEIKKLLSMQHQNIIYINENVEIDYFIMEFSMHRSLDYVLHGPQPEWWEVTDALNWAFQIAKGLEYLHSLNPKFICVDLNPKRLMFFKHYTELKINVLSIYNHIPSRSYKYMAPEAFTMKECLESCDIYSFGIVLWEIMTKKKPFYKYNSYSREELIQLVLDGLHPSESDMPTQYQNIYEFIESCWNKRPERRRRPSQLTEDFQKLRNYFATELDNIREINIFKNPLRICIGSFGIVYKAEWNNKIVAVKKTCKEVKSLTLKAQGLPFGKEEPLTHSNVVNIYYVIQMETFKYIVMDYADCGSLYEYLYDKQQRDYSDELALSWMSQTAEGIKFISNEMFKNNFVGCNVRTGNLMLHANFRKLKILTYIKDTELKSIDIRIKRECLAPEIGFNIEIPKCMNTVKVMVYSFGMVFWQVMSRKRPFYFFDSLLWADVEQLIKSGERPSMSDLRKSKYNFIEDLIQKCWIDQPAERPTIKELCEFLSKFAILNEQSATDKSFYVPSIKLSEIEIKERLGAGSFGIVNRAVWQTKEIAVKKFYEINNMKVFEKEVRQLSRVDHPNIVKIFGISLDKGKAYLLMSYAEGGSLHNYLHIDTSKSYTMQDGVNWMLQCLDGITYMHNMKPKPMIHRDIKPKNLLLSNNFKTLTIGDFGTVTELATKDNTVDCGTFGYMAPEVADVNKNYTAKCDVYSFGITLWEVMTRKKPFYHLKNQNEYTIYIQVIKGVRPHLTDIKLPNSEMLCGIIKKCWDQEPEERSSAANIELRNVPCSKSPIM